MVIRRPYYPISGFRDRIVAAVHDRVKIKIGDRFLAGGQA